MTQWISTKPEEYASKTASLKGDVTIEWSSDKTTYTTYLDGIACLQRISYYKRKAYYINKSVFEKGEL